MTPAGAHVEVIPPGRASVMVCDPCGIRVDYPRTAPAQDAAREHNQAAHAYPEHPLDHTEAEENRA